RPWHIKWKHFELSSVNLKTPQQLDTVGFLTCVDTFTREVYNQITGDLQILYDNFTETLGTVVLPGIG
ncbi:MAG: hypothetical protein MSH28_04745, partial [Clostridiales bacterium]|nr:hypothetical protein [Clostridiales bacterium]